MTVVMNSNYGYESTAAANFNWLVSIVIVHPSISGRTHESETEDHQSSEPLSLLGRLEVE